MPSHPPSAAPLASTAGSPASDAGAGVPLPLAAFPQQQQQQQQHKLPIPPHRPPMLKSIGISADGHLGASSSQQRPTSIRSFDTSVGSEFSTGVGESEGRLKAVRFGEGAKPNRTATQSMADFLRNVPPPELPSPTRSTSSVQEKSRKSPVRLFGLGRLTSKEDGGGRSTAERGASQGSAGPVKVKGLQQVVTPSGQTVQLIPYHPTPAVAPSSTYNPPLASPRTAQYHHHHHHSSPSITSATSVTPSNASSGGAPVLPELRPWSEDEDTTTTAVAAAADLSCSAPPLVSESPYRTTHESMLAAPRGKSLHQNQTESDPTLSVHMPHSRSEGGGGGGGGGSSLLSASTPSPAALPRSTSSPSIELPRIVLPPASPTTAEAPRPSPRGSVQATQDALLAQEAVTLELLGQRVERGAAGELVLGRRVSKRTAAAQTSISAVRSLLEMTRERTTTARSTRSVESAASSAVPPPPSPLAPRGRTQQPCGRTENGERNKRHASVEPAASVVGGESDEERQSAGTFGARTPSTAGTPVTPGSPMPPQAAPPLPTPPPLFSSDSRGSTSSNASGSSWSIHTPALPTVSSAASFGMLSPSLGGGGQAVKQLPSGSKLRPSTAPTNVPSVETKEREALAGRLKLAEERLAIEKEKRRDAERRLKRLQISSREGHARWEEMAGWAVEVIESADKGRHLLGLENARLQRTIDLYRAQFGGLGTSSSSTDQLA